MCKRTILSLVILIDSMGRGGTQRALISLTQGLAQRGYALTVISLSGDDDAEFMQELCLSGASVHSIVKNKLLAGRGLWRVWALLRQARPQLVLTLLPFADQLGRVLGRLAGIPVVSSERSLITFRSPFMRFLDRFTVSLTQRMVFNSREALRQAFDGGMLKQGQGVYIPNGVALASPSAVRAVLREALGIPCSSRVVGSVGRFTEEKGTLYLVEAFILLASRFPDLRLLLAGDGPLRTSLTARLQQAGLAGRALLPGVRPAADMLACMDIFVLPSLVEGMPNALMEAMLAGLPVVASRVGAVPDLVGEGEAALAGLLTPPGDAPALAACVTGLLCDASRAEVLALAGQARMRASFSHETTTAAYDALFRQCLGRG